MVRLRRYRSPGLIFLALGISVTAQSAAVVGYAITRPPHRPMLTVRLGDAASNWDFEITEQEAATAAVRVDGPKGFKLTLKTPAGEMVGMMSQPIQLSEHLRDARILVTATDGTQWSKTIPVKPRTETRVSVEYTAALGQVLVTRQGDRAPMLRCDQPRCGIELAPGTQVKLTAVLGQGATFGGYHQLPMRTPPALRGILGDPLAACVARDAVTAATEGSVFDCTLTVRTDTDLAAEFGLQPKEVDVALEMPKIEDVVKPLTPRPPLAPIEAEKLDEQPLQVALKPPPQQRPLAAVPPPPPPPPPPQEQKKTPPPPPPPNMVMVEVKDDKHVVDKSPDDAKQLSDKNRDVTEETRATKTNLDKESEGREVASRESDDHQSQEVGGPDDRIRQLEETEATTDKHIRETDHSGKNEVAKGAIKGEGGQNGDNGSGENPGVLAMRGIGGRGSIIDNGKDGKKAGKHGTPGINTPLSFKDYERVMGKDRADEERQVAARKMTSKKGRWERKLDAVRSSLENFIPDVRPGNQTALKTRAHPYALYVARMHRRIHELWGFGFLENLDSKGSDYPLNDPNLWVNLEISVNPDGTVHKVTIAKTSGKTEFDVAAVDTVISAAPYEATPEAIRSVDGRIYLRWGFYRNWRQCGTFNVEPYILTEVPDDGGVGVLDDGAMVKNTAKLPGKHRADRPPISTKTVTPDDGLAQQKVSPDTSVTDKQALFAVNLWLSAFTQAQVDKLAKYSSPSFAVNGKVVAQTSAEVKDMYAGLIVESGPMKDYKLLTAGEAGVQGAPEGTYVLQLRTAKAAFSIVWMRTKSGDYLATQLAR